jgi:hypothetical protein
MKHINLQERRLEEEFAFKAADWFSKNDKGVTYSAEGGRIIPGEYFAVRWGLGNDCVLVLKLDEFYEPQLYGNII